MVTWKPAATWGSSPIGTNSVVPRPKVPMARTRSARGMGSTLPCCLSEYLTSRSPPHCRATARLRLCVGEAEAGQARQGRGARQGLLRTVSARSPDGGWWHPSFFGLVGPLLKLTCLGLGCQAQSGYRPKHETHDRSSGAPQAHRQGTGNPGPHPGARRRAHLLQGGVRATNNEQLRRAAGVSESQLNHYFPTKESLVLAVIAWQAERVLPPYQRGRPRHDRRPEPPAPSTTSG
ncbi:MAG: TetR/AcrR family transcriptional regulator [Actinoallomurus sp.]